MLEIKPNFDRSSARVSKAFPDFAENRLKFERLAWTGMNICSVFSLADTDILIYEVLETGHNLQRPCLLIPNNDQLFLPQESLFWMGQPLLEAFQNPSHEKITIRKEVFKERKSVIVLNCIDYLYGHCLLKLLNAQRHLTRHSHYGLIVIIPAFLRWMVPDGVAEIWTVEVSLRRGQKYYLAFDKFVNTELERFEKVLLSEAFLHPSLFNIDNFTGVKKHNFADEFRVTYIWREDRLWVQPIVEKLSRGLKKLNLFEVGIFIQGVKIRRLFENLRKQLPNAHFTVVGLGTQYCFPAWIEDSRVDSFSVGTERKFCEIYAQSRVVVGLHGSNMLLPSGHAGMTVNLLPTSRIGNFCQDILYQEFDSRVASFRYRFLPARIRLSYLVDTILSMISNYTYFAEVMTRDTCE